MQIVINLVLVFIVTLLHETAHVVVGRHYGFHVVGYGVRWLVMPWVRLVRVPVSNRGMVQVHAAPLLLHLLLAPLAMYSGTLGIFGWMNILILVTNCFLSSSDGRKAWREWRMHWKTA